MITIFKTGEFNYDDAGIDKPVKYNVNNLIEVASRISNVPITKEHSKEIIGEMSNFIVEDGLLKANEPNNLELSGMGFSPVFNFDLMDMGDYYVPKNITMTEIGYTKTPRTHIVYNSIVVPNEDRKMEDTQLRQSLDENRKLQEEIGVYKKQISQLKKSNTEKDKEIKEIKDSYSDVDAKLKEYESLKDTETKYNQLISSKKDDLIHKITGGNDKLAEKYANFDVSELEIVLETMSSNAEVKGITPRDTLVDDGNLPTPTNDEDEYTDEMFEADFKASGL